MYKQLRTLFFLLDAERAHYTAMNGLKYLPGAKTIAKRLFQYQNASLSKTVLAYLKELAALGFGFVEIGTVTPLPQPGNDKPRLFRLPKDKALINRMGFNNDGTEAIKKRLIQWKASQLTTHRSPLIVGCNIGKQTYCK